MAAESDIPIIGVIHAGAKTAVESTRNGRIGVIGTEATIGSGIYTEVMKKDEAGAFRCSANPVRCLFRWWRKGCFMIR